MAREKSSGTHRMTKRQVIEMLLSIFKSQPERTFSFKDIFRQLDLKTHPAKMLAIDTMEEMAWDDTLAKVSDNSYRLNTEGQVQEGRFIRKANGKNSFVPDGSDKPIFVAERNSMSALTGDRVRVTFMARRARHIREAQVIKIIERAKDTFVGRLRVTHDFAFLVTQEELFTKDILIPKKKLKGGKTDDMAVVRITQWPDEGHKNIVGEVVDILGKQGDNTAEMHAILAQYGLPYKYPKAVEDAAKKISGEITEDDLKGREDFRDVWTCTIDPHDAKDFDDALSIRIAPETSATPATSGTSGKSGNPSSEVYEVGVHIADVSHYVTEGSIIDREAQRRATSIYLVDRTIPMLPEHLCNFVCSLRPDEDKLCYSVIFTLDSEANVKDYRIVHTVIRSNRRYAYEEVQQLLEANGVAEDLSADSSKQKTQNKKSKTPPYEGENAWQLITLDRLAKCLREKRMAGGAMQFEGEELKFDVDKDGKPTRCYFKRSKDANKLIEEFMLLANRTVAEHIGKIKKSPKQKTKTQKPKTFIYRVHDNPDPQKLETLRGFVGRIGLKLSSSSTKGATARALNKLMDEVEGTPRQKLVQTAALRAMMKAKYTTHNIGHFGLAFDYYTHFTSPIRRYPDTMVHRLLTRYQEGGKSANQKYYEEQCEHSSDMEQVAQQAERDSIKYKMVEFMEQHVGEVFDAHISGIQSYGIYCEIDENHCEGLIHLRDLDNDYYEFDEKNYQLVGRRHHRRYQLGDPIRIQVDYADLEKKQLGFIPAPA